MTRRKAEARIGQRQTSKGRIMKCVTPELLYDYSSFYSLQWSPSGRQAAAICAVGDREKKDYRRDLCLIRGEQVVRLTWAGDVRFFLWEDDETLLFAADRTEEEKKRRKYGEPFTAIYRLSTEGGEAQLAFEVPFDATSGRRLSGNQYLFSGGLDLHMADYITWPEEERKHFLEAQRKEDAVAAVCDESPWCANGAGLISGKRTALYRWNAAEKTAERLTDPEIDVSGYDTDGKTVIYVGEKICGRRTMRERLWQTWLEDRETRQLAVPEMYFHFICFAGPELLFAASDGKRYGVNENPKIFRYDFAEDQAVEIADPDLGTSNEVLTDVSLHEEAVVHGDRSGVYFASTVRNHTEIFRAAPDGSVETVIQREGSISGFDVKNGRFLLSALYQMLPEEIYSWESGAEFRQITHVNEKLLQDTYVAAPHRVTVQSEGLDIDGWVLYPKDFQPDQKYPAILDIHGGPKCAYGEVYFHEMQVWASEGYFVLYCNPYGGDGRGNAFAAMADRYGTTDYRNLMDFTDEVIRKFPAIDPGRLCVTGGSYGGFMTNWVVTHTNRFAAAATQRSISNWVSMYGISDIGPMFAEDQNDAKFTTAEGIEQMWRHSPLKYIAAAETPTLVLHSDEDHRCPVSEGIQFYTALREKGVDARMVIFHGENHELSRSGKPEARIRRLKEIHDWFERHLNG